MNDGVINVLKDFSGSLQSGWEDQDQRVQRKRMLSTQRSSELSEGPRQAGRAELRYWSQEGWFSGGTGVKTEAGLVCVGGGKRMVCELVAGQELG